MTQTEHGQVNVSYNHHTLQSEPIHAASLHFNAFMALHQSILYVMLCICALSFMSENKVQQEAFLVILSVDRFSLDRISH